MSNLYREMKELGIDPNSIHSASQLQDINREYGFLKEEERREKEALIERQNKSLIEELQRQVKELKKANEFSRYQAEEAKKEASKSKRFAWITFLVSTSIALASLIVALFSILK